MKCAYHDLGDCEPGELCSSEVCPVHCRDGCDGRCDRKFIGWRERADDLKERLKADGKW